jgi:hypothetical protein
MQPERAYSWYFFANRTLGKDAPNGSLYIITSCDKTKSWELGAFRNKSHRRVDFSFSIKTAAASIAPTISWNEVIDCSPCLRHLEVDRIHPPPPEEDVPMNQAVFIKGFKLMLGNKQRTNLPFWKNPGAITLENSSYEDIMNSRSIQFENNPPNFPPPGSTANSSGCNGGKLTSMDRSNPHSLSSRGNQCSTGGGTPADPNEPPSIGEAGHIISDRMVGFVSDSTIELMSVYHSRTILPPRCFNILLLRSVSSLDSFSLPGFSTTY